MKGMTKPGTARQAIAACIVGGFLLGASAACSAENKGPQVSDTATSRPNSSESGPATASPSAGSTTAASAPPSGTSGSGESARPTPVATALSWKTYTDPAKTVSFELPQDWITQSVDTDAGALPGAVKVEVKDSAGKYVATLQTGLPPAEARPCSTGQARPYVVISSVPLDVPHSNGPDTIDPRVVFRVIQGYKFFGSYGITNMVAGADGHSCELRNRVQGPAGRGDYSFGDVAAVHAFAADEKVAPAKTFDTLDLAAKYVAHGSEFANVQRMLLSLKVNL
ncbi:hypothetical protein AB0N65_05225 [Paenarthrobacter sp. NPDC089322]|uniref:hypothetical protein n=1 Tax=Paenarthrobacter sp. NPDC089322 TaxID=3155065 RepID=UPI003440F410